MKKLAKKPVKTEQTIEAYSWCHCGCYPICGSAGASVSYSSFLSEKYGNEDSVYR